MKVAIVTTSYPEQPGDPSGHFVEAEARALADAGHQVCVLSPNHREHEERGLEHVRVLGASLFGWPGALERLKRAPWRFPGALSFVASVKATLARLGPFDEVIAHWIVPCAWPAAVGHFPLTVVAHGSDVRLLQRLPRAISQRILGELNGRGANFRCVSEALRRDLIALCPELASSAWVEASPLTLDAAPSRREARARLRVSGRLILIVGRLVPDKRVNVALNACELLTDAQVVVIGDGPLLGPYAQHYANVRFLGKLDHHETLAWIAAADLLLSASLKEGAPTAVREALALGVDVVACPAGDLHLWSEREPRLWVTRAAVPSP